MADKTIAILTGGGDVPGLNSVIKSVVYGATSKPGYRVVGIRRGWAGLTYPNLDDGFDEEYFVDLTRANTRTIDRTGGTFLHTSRTKPSRLKVDRLPQHVKKRLGGCKEVDPGPYKSWCAANEEDILTRKAFKDRLQDKGFECKREKEGIFWCGIGLDAETFQRESSTEPDPDPEVV